MYLTIRRYRADRANINEAVRRTERDFLPNIRRVSGFVSYYCMKTDDGIVTVSVFDTREAAEESNRRAADFVSDLASLLPDPPEITMGEVPLYEFGRVTV